MAEGMPQTGQERHSGGRMGQGHAVASVQGGQAEASTGTALSVFHLCSYYPTSTVYRNLFHALAQNPRIESQVAFVPVRRGTFVERVPGVALHSSECLGVGTRLSLWYKQWTLRAQAAKLLRNHPEIRQTSLIHAHTLYADGVLARQLADELAVPYVVTVRTTDASIFNRYFVHWEARVKAVLRGARSVVFVSAAHKRQFEAKYGGLMSNSVLIPNGLERFWLDRALLSKPKRDDGTLQALFVGAVNRNKNVKRAIQAFFSITSGKRKRMSIIGGSYDEYVRVYGPLSPELRQGVTFHGRISDLAKLRAEFQSADVLVVPSHCETFGLVYLEAISQCTPVVYSVDQGIDGLFPEGEVGRHCDASSVHSIRAAIEKSLQEHPTGLDFTSRGENPVSGFSWSAVAGRLLSEAYVHVAPSAEGVAVCQAR